MYRGTGAAERGFALSLLLALLAGGIYFTGAGDSYSFAFLSTPGGKPDAHTPPDRAEVEVERNSSANGSEASHSGVSISQPAEPATAEVADVQPPAEDWSWDHQPIDEYLAFLTPYSEQVVRSFRIKCPQPDHSIRLIDAMREGLRLGASYGKARLHMTADSQGDEVRISSQIWMDGQAMRAPRVVASIDGWGELRLHGISWNGVMDLCYR